MNCIFLRRGYREYKDDRFKITLLGALDASVAYIKINGETYSPETVVKVNPETEVQVVLGASGKNAYIYLDGIRVAGVAGRPASYKFVPTSNVTISFTQPSSSQYQADIITESVDGGATTIPVTITGTGTLAGVTIAGTKYSSPITLEVSPGDTMVFTVKGGSSTYPGIVEIDGALALRVASNAVGDHTWTVPTGISGIQITLAVVASKAGRITVTTT